MARILKGKLEIDRQTKEVSRVSLGGLAVERRERRRLPTTDLYRRAESSMMDDPESDDGTGKPK